MNNNIQNLDTNIPEYGLKEILHIILRGKWLIIFASFITISISIYYSYSTVPEYVAEVSIMIKKYTTTAEIFNIGSSSSSKAIEDEIEIISSRVVAEAVVEELWATNQHNNLYTFGTAEFKPRGQRPRRWLKQILTLGIWDPASETTHQYNTPLSQKLKQRLAKSIQGTISVTNRRNTNILIISCTTPFAGESALLANTLAEIYQWMDKVWSSDEVLNLKGFLEEQLNEKDKELRIAEDNLKSYKEKTLIFGLSSDAELLLNQLVQLEARYYNNLAEVNIAKVNHRYLTQHLSEKEKELVETLLSSIDARLFALRQEIGVLESNLVKNASLYGEGHAEVLNIQRKIDQLKQKLDSETHILIDQGLTIADPVEYRQELITELLTLEGEMSVLDAKSTEYKKLVDKYSRQLNTLPNKQLDYARLERDRSVLAKTFEYMQHKLEEARVTYASQAGKIRIIDSALSPTRPSRPNKKANIILGVLAGLAIGVGIVFLAEHLDNSVRTIETVERYGLTLLGLVPLIGGEKEYRRKRKRDKSKKGHIGSSTSTNASSVSKSDIMRRRLITREDPKSPTAEAYRTIRTNILYPSSKKDIKSILVSSPGPAEGKTTTVTNLAITFANLGKRTLLLDADLRRPVIHRIFEIPRDPGISAYLSGAQDDFEPLVRETSIENLFVVSAGIIPPNPSELIGSERMTELIAELEKKWDVILLDSPPIIAVTDASMISTEIDSVILVVKTGETNKVAFRRAIQLLQGVQTPLAGVVMNGVSKKSTYDSYYYYYQYYHYYDSSGS